jgi:PiT family inorganic phosphate transporter
MRTLGARIYRWRPVHGFGAQLAGSVVILSAAVAGGPMSTTQVTASAILGAGAAERLNKVRWLVLGDKLTAWVLTFPACMLLTRGFLRLLGAKTG